MTTRVEQYREQLKEEMKYAGNKESDSDEVQHELEAEMLRLTKKTDRRPQDDIDLYDLVYETRNSDQGFFGSSKQARDTKKTNHT